jgi:hypothetical protein
MRKIILTVLFASLSLVWTQGWSQTSMQSAASSDMDSLKTWQDLEAWRKKYAPKYDNGFYAEGIADFVGKKFVANWQSLSELISLSAASPGLFEFAVAHLGEITGCDSGKVIVENSINNCPVGFDGYCKKIRNKLIPGAHPQCLPKLPDRAVENGRLP